MTDVNLLCTRLVQTVTPSTSGEEGARQILRYTDVRGRRFGSARQLYTKGIAQETVSNSWKMAFA